MNAIIITLIKHTNKATIPIKASLISLHLKLNIVKTAHAITPIINVAIINGILH